MTAAGGRPPEEPYSLPKAKGSQKDAAVGVQRMRCTAGQDGQPGPTAKQGQRSSRPQQAHH